MFAFGVRMDVWVEVFHLLVKVSEADEDTEKDPASGISISMRRRKEGPTKLI